MTKLNWEFDNELNCEVAMHNGYRIKAERDESPSNPFEEWDCEWPILVQTGRNGYGYDVTRYTKNADHALDEPFRYFNDAQLIHNQVHIAKALETTIREITCYGVEGESAEPVNYCRDADHLREQFTELQQNFGEGKQFELLVELYTLAGIAAYTSTARGYCQGDWANVLVVAVPEAMAKFGCTEVKAEDLSASVDLYGYWAFGDVYGYVIERPVLDDDGEIVDWEDACDHNSCWGYYGDEHDKSGLEESALEAVPEEPALVPELIEEFA